MKRFSILLILLASSLFISEQKVFAAKAKPKSVEEINPFELYPEDFSAILKNAIKLSSSGNFDEAVNYFDEKIYNYKKEEINDKTLTRLELISADIQKQVREYKKLRMEKAAKKIDFSNVQSFSSVENYFIQLATINNKIRELGQQIQLVGISGYPFYLSKFILGINEEPTSGLAGTIETEFLKELEQTMSCIWKKSKISCKIVETALIEENIFSNTITLKKAEAELENILLYSEDLSKLYSLFSKIKGKRPKTSKENSEFKSSIKAIKSLCNDGKKIFNTLALLQTELKILHPVPENKIENIRSENDSYANNLASSASNLTAWGKIATSSAKSNTLSTLSFIQNENLSWQSFTIPYKQACYKIEAKCTQSAISMWIKVANYYADTGILLYDEDFQAYEKIKNYMQGINGVYYPSRCVQELETLKNNIKKDKDVLEECKTKLNNGYIYRSNFIRQQEIIAENFLKITELEKEFKTIESDAESKILKARLAKNEIELYYEQAKSYNEKNNFQQSITNLQIANSSYSRLSEDLKNDGDIQTQVFSELNKLRNEIIEKQQPIFNKELRKIKTEARTAYYAGDFEKAISSLSQADAKREMWSKLLDISLEKDTELERIKNFANTAIAIKEGREIQPYDSKAPEMRQNLSLAGKYYEKGSELIKQGKRKEATSYFKLATDKINQVKVYYPRNKIASVLSLKITKNLNEENFAEIFKIKVQELMQVNYAKRNSYAQESYSSLLDLYEMNPTYPGLKEIIENAEYAMGLKQKAADKTEKAQATKLAKEAQEILGKALRDPILLQQAKEKAQAAIEINPDNNIAITVLDEIALRTGQQAAVVLSADDEALYQSALSDLQKNKIFDANEKLTQLMKNSNYTRSAKIIKLKKRIEAQL